MFQDLVEEWSGHCSCELLELVEPQEPSLLSSRNTSFAVHTARTEIDGMAHSTFCSVR
jgi:hypothetical protein